MTDDIFLVEMNRPTTTVVDVALEDWTAIRNDVDELEARLNALKLGLGLTNVADEADEAADGQVLVYNGTTEEWGPGDAQAGIHVETGPTPATVNLESVRLMFSHGLTATDSPSLPGERSIITAAFAGSGSANTVARSDHVHTQTANPVDTFDATGLISSGSRTLIEHPSEILTTGVPYDLFAFGFVVLRNNVNSGIVNLRLQIAGGPVISYPAQNVGGVPSPYPIFQELRNHTGAGAAVNATLSVQYQSGDPTDVRAGMIWLTSSPRR